MKKNVLLFLWVIVIVFGNSVNERSIANGINLASQKKVGSQMNIQVGDALDNYSEYQTNIFSEEAHFIKDVNNRKYQNICHKEKNTRYNYSIGVVHKAESHDVEGVYFD